MKNLIVILLVLPAFALVSCNKKDEPSIESQSESVEVQKNKIYNCTFEVVETSKGLEVKTFQAKGSCGDCKDLGKCQETGTKLENLIASIDQVLARGPRQTVKNYMEALRPEVVRELSHVNSYKGGYQAEEDRKNKVRSRAYEVGTKFQTATGVYLSLNDYYSRIDYSADEAVVNMMWQIVNSREIIQALKSLKISSASFSTSDKKVDVSSYGTFSFNPYTYINKDDQSFKANQFLKDLTDLQNLRTIESDFQSATGIPLSAGSFLGDEKALDLVSQIIKSKEIVEAIKTSAANRATLSKNDPHLVEISTSGNLYFNPLTYASDISLDKRFLTELRALPNKQEFSEYKSLSAKIEAQVKDSFHCSESFQYCLANARKIAAVLDRLTFDGKHYLSIMKQEEADCDKWDSDKRNPIFLDATKMTDEQLISCINTGKLPKEKKKSSARNASSQK
jgi:hypothetical protein